MAPKCAVCGEEVGEVFVARDHYIQHFGPRLLEAAWDRPVLRCPFPDCIAGNKTMKPLLLGLHLETIHGCLKAVLEANSPPGIASALALLYPTKEEPGHRETIETLEVEAENEPEEEEVIVINSDSEDEANPKRALVTANKKEAGGHKEARVELKEEVIETLDILDDPLQIVQVVCSPDVYAPPPSPSPPISSPFLAWASRRAAASMQPSRPLGPSRPPASSLVSVFRPAPCLLCTDKAGRELRLGTKGTAEVSEHYKLCLWEQGMLQAAVPAGPANTGLDGEVLDSKGERFKYLCLSNECDKRLRKPVSYREYTFHAFQFHGAMRPALEAAMARRPDLRPHLLQLLQLLQPEPLSLSLSLSLSARLEPRVEEVHTCLLCRGLQPGTMRPKKDGLDLPLNICTTRNHYASDLADMEEGKAFFRRHYPTVPGAGERIVCPHEACNENKRFREGWTNVKQFNTHMALYHGALERFILEQGSAELRAHLPRLECLKVPKVCFVSDHYGA